MPKTPLNSKSFRLSSKHLGEHFGNKGFADRFHAKLLFVKTKNRELALKFFGKRLQVLLLKQSSKITPEEITVLKETYPDAQIEIIPFTPRK